jgi:DNA-binding transcriptional regulator YdaS (Cro superfamily)
MPRYSLNLDNLQKAIDIAGGITPLSSKSKISYQSIIDWKSGRKCPSPISCKKIEKAVNGEIKAEELLTDYPWEDFK